MILPLDASITESHRDAYQEIIDQYGRVDILVANAAIDQRSRAADTPMSVERRIMDVNYFGVLSLIHAVMPDMRTRNEGHIVVISSVMGYVSTPLHSSYAASKHALHGYLEGLRSELYRTRIRFTIVCPGFVRTEISLHALLKDGSEYGRMDATHEKAMTADVFARRAVRAIRRRRNEVLIGGPEIGTVYIRRFFPRLFRFLMPRLYHLVAKGYRPQ